LEAVRPGHPDDEHQLLGHVETKARAVGIGELARLDGPAVEAPPAQLGLRNVARPLDVDALPTAEVGDERIAKFRHAGRIGVHCHAGKALQAESLADAPATREHPDRAGALTDTGGQRRHLRRWTHLTGGPQLGADVLRVPPVG